MTYPAIPPVDYSTRVFNQVKYDLTQGAAMPRLQNAGNIAVPDNQGRTWRVTLTPPNGIPPSDLFRAFNFGSTPLLARVTWGNAEGQKFVAEVDWSRGRSFCIHATTVQVDAVLAADAIATATILKNAPRVFTIGCSINPASDNGNDLPPTRTIFTGSILATQLAIVQLPPFTRLIRWYQIINTDAALAPLPIFLDFADDAAFTVIRQTSPTGFTTSPLTWPNERGLTVEATAQWLGVTNADLADTLSLAIECELDIG